MPIAQAALDVSRLAARLGHLKLARGSFRNQNRTRRAPRLSQRHACSVACARYYQVGVVGARRVQFYPSQFRLYSTARDCHESLLNVCAKCECSKQVASSMNSMHAFSTGISTFKWKKSFNCLPYSNCEARRLVPLLVEGRLYREPRDAYTDCTVCPLGLSNRQNKRSLCSRSRRANLLQNRVRNYEKE